MLFSVTAMTVGLRFIQSPRRTQKICKSIADFLSHLGKWVKLIKFEAKNEFFCTWKVEKPQCTTSTP